jgi:hypothetical protein
MPPAVPVAVPSKVAYLQAKSVRESDSQPLGAGMGSSAFRGDNKYCHNGGTTFAPSYRARRRPAPLRGSMIGTFGPLYGTLRSC